MLRSHQPARRRSPWFYATVACLTLATASCGSDDDTDDQGGTGPSNNTVDKVVVTPGEAVLAAGRTISLVAQLYNSAGAQISGAVQWGTSDAAVATVSPSGIVSGVASGVARITVTAANRTGSSVVSVQPSTTQAVPASGTVATPGGEVRVTVPNGAAAAGATVTIEPVTNPVPGMTVPGTVYKVGMFNIPVGTRPTITVRYSIVGLPPGFDETKLSLSRKVGAFWIPLPSTVNTSQKTITATLPDRSFGLAADVFAATSATHADDEATLGATLFAFETDVTTLEITGGERRRITGRIRSLTTGALVTPSSPSVSINTPTVLALSGPPTVSGTDMIVDFTAINAGVAVVTLSATVTNEGGSEQFGGSVPVTVSPPTSLGVTVTGLPGVVNGAVTVSGPGGFNRQITATTNFGPVAPGTYTITAQDVSAGGQTYRANPPSQTVTLNAGETKTAAVGYTATLGSLTVSVGGLPAGVNAAVTVSGPGGFMRSLTSTETLTGLVAGSYTIAAANVTSGGQLYAPGPATQTVTVVAAQTASVSVNYVIGAGGLTVTIGGLPTGVNALVTVTGPNGFNRQLTGTEQLSGLPPGSYTIQAANVDIGDQIYAPDALSRSAAVVAGQTTAATVTYRATLGSLNVVINGLPANTNAAVTVNGPSASNVPLTRTAQLSRLTPGSYSIVAANVLANEQLYVATVVSSPVVLSAGLSATVQVTYSRNVGSLTVTIDLGPCYEGDVTVSGPGLTQIIKTTKSFVDITPGVYTITARTGTNPPLSELAPACEPTVSTQQVTVSPGATASTTVTYVHMHFITVVGSGNGSATVAPLPCNIIAGAASGVCTQRVRAGSPVSITITALSDSRITGITHVAGFFPGGPCTFTAAPGEVVKQRSCNYTPNASATIEVQLAKLEVGCSGEAGSKSLNSDTAVPIRFINTSSEAVTVYWLDFSGVRVSYGVIQPGAFMDQGTYLTHPWVFVGASGNCHGGVFYPSASVTTYNIP